MRDCVSSKNCFSAVPNYSIWCSLSSSTVTILRMWLFVGFLLIVLPEVLLSTGGVATILDECPPGFYIDKDGNKSVCRCSSYEKSKSYRGVAKCDDNHGELVAYLRSQYWAGYQTNTSKTIMTANCPDNYCNTSDNGLIQLPSVASKELLDSAMCGAKYRTGRLCGECLDGYHVYVNSPTFDCGKCDDDLSKHGILFLMLLKYLPLTLFLCFILFFNFSLIDGPLNAFILFSQIIFAMDIYASGAIGEPDSGDWLARPLVRFYKLSYGIWNLNFFETLVDPFCSVKFKSALPILTLQYVSACFPLALFLLFFKVIPWLFDWLVASRFVESHLGCIRNCALVMQRKFIRLRSYWSVRNSVIQGLTTLLVLSYAKITALTWYLLSYGVLYGPGGENSKVKITVSWVDGTKPYLSGIHGRYAIVAFVFLFCFVLLAPILLLLYPYLPKLINKLNWEEKWIVRKLSIIPLHHAIPFYDAIQGCFKDEYRFFAVFYFVYRIIAFAIYSFTTTVALHYLWQIGFYTIVFLIHCFFQPYKKRWHNCLDASIFSLLIAINAFSFYRYHQYTATLSTAIKSFWIQLIIIYLPLCYFVIYVAKEWWKWCYPRTVSRWRKWRGKNGFQKITHDQEDFPARLEDMPLHEFTEKVDFKARSESMPPNVALDVANNAQTYGATYWFYLLLMLSLLLVLFFFYCYYIKL